MTNSILDRLFTSDRWWLLKVGGAGVFGLAIGVRILWQNRNDPSPLTTVLALLAVPSLVMLGAGLLIWADVVRRKRRSGETIGMLSRLFFGAGIWSVLIWVVGLLIVGFPVAIWLGAMTADAPAG